MLSLSLGCGRNGVSGCLVRCSVPDPNTVAPRIISVSRLPPPLSLFRRVCDQASGGEAELEWNMEEIKAPASTGAADATVAAGADASVNGGDGTSSGGGKPSAAATNDASRGERS